MSEGVILWLFGIAIAAGGAWCAWLTNRVSDLNETVVKLVTMLSLQSEKAAEILHRDDDLFGIDALLDKYISRHHELSVEEWNRLLQVCEKIISNPDLPKGERLAALLVTQSKFLRELAIHKTSYKGHKFQVYSRLDGGKV
jgi:hypothetical protein